MKVFTHLVHFDVVGVHAFVLQANADSLLTSLALEANSVASEQLEFLHLLLGKRND